jgi:RNA polymerase sigma-70 factor, ECF subfamily
MSLFVPAFATQPDPAAEGEAALHAAPGLLGWVSAVVHVHRERLLAYARRNGLGAEDALDAVQDSFISFLRLPEARSIAREGDDALKLLTVIVRHNVQNQLSKRRRRSRAQALVETEAAQLDDESSEVLITRAEELARVQGCILRMAHLQRQVVMLSLLDEQPQDRVAQLLGISSGYVRVLLHRAREHVRHCPLDEMPVTSAPIAT